MSWNAGGMEKRGMSDAGTSWWLGADKMWRKGRPPSGWHQTRDGLWHPPSTAATRLKPSDSGPVLGLESRSSMPSAEADELIDAPEVPFDPVPPVPAPPPEPPPEPPPNSVFVDPDPAYADDPYGGADPAEPSPAAASARVLRHMDTDYGGYGSYDSEADAPAEAPSVGDDLPADPYGVDDPYGTGNGTGTGAYGARSDPYRAESPYGSADRHGAYYQPNGHDATAATAATAATLAPDETVAADVAIGEVGIPIAIEDDGVAAVDDDAEMLEDEHDSNARHMADGQPVLWDVAVERMLAWPAWMRVALPCAAVLLLLGGISVAWADTGSGDSGSGDSSGVESTFNGANTSTTDGSSSSVGSGPSSSSTSSTAPGSSSSTSPTVGTSAPSMPPPAGGTPPPSGGTSPTTRPPTTTVPPTTAPPPPPSTTTTTTCGLFPPFC